MMPEIQPGLWTRWNRLVTVLGVSSDPPPAIERDLLMRTNLVGQATHVGTEAKINVYQKKDQVFAYFADTDSPCDGRVVYLDAGQLKAEWVEVFLHDPT